jgi:hypothetical protein
MFFGKTHNVIPAKAGIQTGFTDGCKASLDSRLRGNAEVVFCLVVVLGAIAATPALATEWEHCSDSGGAASFDYLAGDGLDVLSVSALTVTAGEKVWASDPANGPGDPVSIGQAFEDADTIRIDALDKDAAIVASLRLFKATDGGTVATGGTLSIKGLGAWAVSCDPG